MRKNLNPTNSKDLAAAMRAEAKAFRALMNDPRPLADPMAEHTLELKFAWMAAADAERAIRERIGFAA